jgi:nitrogen fixation protein
MKNLIISVGLLALFSNMACTPKAILDQSTRTNLSNQSITAEKLQFYLNKDIELRRVITSNDTKLNGGKITFANGKRVEVISIKAFTPGICLKSSNNSIDVAFETKSDHCLTFKPMQSESDKAYYSLSGFEQKDGQLLINYGANTYVIDQQYADAKILIKRKIAHKTRTKVTKIKGRKL